MSIFDGFGQCFLKLSQVDEFDPTLERWVQVELCEAQCANAIMPVNTHRSLEKIVRENLNLNHEALAWWGPWYLRQNSVTGNYYSGYTVGSSASQEYKFWFYSVRYRTLDFSEWAPMGDGTVDIKAAVTLHDAWMWNRGIDPFVSPGKLFNRSRQGPEINPYGGRGTVYIPSPILRKGPPIHWVRTTMLPE